MSRVIVVGAGISGLTTSFRLQQLLPDADIVLLEEASECGGVIRTVRREGYLVETGPNGFPDNNPATLQLVREIGLEDQLISASQAASKNRFLFLQERLRLLPGSLSEFLRSDLLSWIAKLRLLLERYRPPRSERGEESIDSFARWRVGDEVSRVLVDPFVTGILAGDPKLLSVQACFPRLVSWVREHGSVIAGMIAARRQRANLTQRVGKLWSMREGLNVLIRGLVDRLRQPPKVSSPVHSLFRTESGWAVETEHERFRADSVVLTCPAYRQAELLLSVDPELAELLAGIAYNAVVVVALGFRRTDVPHSLNGFGYLTPQRDRRDLLGVQWCSSIYPGRAKQQHILLRALCGGWHRRDQLQWTDEQLVKTVRRELKLALGIRAIPQFQHLVRWHRAIPQYFVGHLDRVMRIEQRLAQYPGLYLGGSAFRGVAINDCVEQSSLLAKRIHADLVGNRLAP